MFHAIQGVYEGTSLSIIPSRRVRISTLYRNYGPLIGKKSFLCRDRMTTFEATVPLGHRGWGTEENVMKTTDELLVVYSVYKRENDR